MTSESRQKAVVGRREFLWRGAASAAGAAGAVGIAKLISPEEALGQCVTTGSQTQGPFWVDEMLNRSDIRSDPGTGQLQTGMPLRLSINVSEIQGAACSPVAGAYVDIWHCNAAGAYSDVTGAGNPNTVGQRWLRGYQLTDAHGNARFLTIYPGWYMGRTVHIHFRVRKFSGATTTFNFTSQMYFQDAITNAIFASTAPYSSRPGRNPALNTQDMLYNGNLLLRMARNGGHALATFDAVINAEVGSNHQRATPTDEDSLEHLHDFGGGSPSVALLC